LIQDVLEKVFESFVAGLLVNPDYGAIPKEFKDSTVKAQHHIGYLLEERKFQLIPDITVITKDGKRVIIDTKYKLLNRKDRKLGVSQIDLYQMYAYATQWNSDTVILLYPDISGSPIQKEWHFNIRGSNSSEVPKRVPIAVRSINIGHNLLDEEGWDEFIKGFKRSISVQSGGVAVL
jgi:5-methylcytosine-specific restriction enzyme subunit McrC